MATRPDLRSNGWRVRWTYRGRRHQLIEQYQHDAMMAYRFIDDLGDRIDPADPLLVSRAYLYGGVIPDHLDPDKGVITFAMAADAYVATKNWQENTEAQFKGRLKNYYADWGSWDVGQFTDNHLNAKFKSFLAKGLKESTAITYIEPALQILTFAHDRGWLKVNPAKSRYLAFTRTVPPSDSRDALTSEEYEAILALAPDLVTYDIILTLGQCGLRIGEVFALRCEDIDLVGQTMTVRATMHKCKRQPWAKGARRRKPRIIALNAAFCAVLENYVKGRPAQAPVFPGPRAGGHQSPDNWRDRVWNPMRDEAAAKKLVRPRIDLVPHILRHSMATWYAEHVPLRLVGERLGHQSEKTTQVYVHRNLRGERNLMDRVYSAPGRETLKR